MAKSVTKTATTPIVTPVAPEVDKTSDAYLESMLFVIEEHVELPNLYRAKSEVWDKLEKIMNSMTKINMAFVVKQPDVYKVQKLAIDKFPEWRFKVTTIVGNPAYKRVFRIA